MAPVVTVVTVPFESTGFPQEEGGFPCACLRLWITGIINPSMAYESLKGAARTHVGFFRRDP